MSGVYLIRNDAELVEFTKQGFESEELLQGFLAKYPNLLAGDQINSDAPRRWLLISRELGLSSDNTNDRWAVDHLFLDQDAIPTIVEVKRSSDTRIRREVVGQMLDYASNGVVYWPVEKLQAAFESSCEKSGLDPTEVLTKFLMGSEAAEFWQEAKTNLQAGRIRLVFVSDAIPPELRRIVEFLNAQMDPAEVLAVEIKQFVGEGQRTLIPRLLGQTVEAQQKKGIGTTESRQWDETSFLQELETRQGKGQANVARKLLDWAEARMPRLVWGKGRQDGSVKPVLEYANTPYSFFTVYTYGRVEVQFQYFKSQPPFAAETKRLEFLERLNQIRGVALARPEINLRPSIRLSVLEDKRALAKFLEALDWALDQVMTQATEPPDAPTAPEPKRGAPPVPRRSRTRGG